MKNTKTTKKEKTIILIIITVTIILISMLKSVDYDMAWEFNWILNITNGKIPYKDFNMVVTPFYLYMMSVPALFLKNIIGYKIACMLFTTSISYIFFTIIRTIIKQEKLSYAILSLFVVLISSIGPNYNIAVILFGYAAGIFIIFFIRNNNKALLSLSGIMLALCILCKQSTGSIIALLIFIYLIYYLIKNKKSINILYMILPFFGVFLLTTLFLLKVNALKEFIELTILGLLKFRQNIHLFLFEQGNDIYGNLSGIFLIILITLNIILNIKIKNEEILILQIIALGNLSGIYPIMNFIHNMIAAIPLLLTLFLLISKFIEDTTVNNIIIYLFLGGIMIFTFSINAIVNATLCKNGYLKNAFIKNACYEKAIDIDIYKSKHEDYILYSPEESYTLEQLYDNKSVDGFLSIFHEANLGNMTVTEALQQYEGQKNTYMYIYKDRKLCEINQTPLSAIKYIEENYELVDTTEFYKIYKVK